MSYKKLAISFAVMLFGVTVLAQEAKIPVKVHPHQAYVFLDGVAIRDGDLTLKTTPGEHTIAVYNYGFTGQVRKVVAQAGKNEVQSFDLQPAGSEVAGPYGYIQIEGPSRAAVLLNGTTPDYLVGHVDEFNHHIGWSQQLIVPAGTHQMLVTRENATVWSGPIEVAAGQRVILYIPEGKTKVQSVDNGTAARPRFTVGIASANVTIAPVSGSFAAKPANIDCNQVSQLAYSSQETLHSSIKNAGEVKQLPTLTGEEQVSPRQTTTYNFEASGPGGVVKQDATVNVNPVIQSSLEPTPAEVHYLKVGNKVLTQESADLKWTVNNADAISIESIGKVPANAPGTTVGQEKVTPEPKGEVIGALDETKQYTLTASNVCGGSDTKTAQLRMKGMNEPYMLSIFFPTGYPTRHKPDIGLVGSQQASLLDVAKAFPIYAEHTPDAKIVIRGHADPRGSDKYNLKLSERRIAKVKGFLVAQGIPEDKIILEPMGKSKSLDAATVQQLEAENPFKAVTKKHSARATRLAYNRRIDIEFQPADMETTRFFPHQVKEADLLMQQSWPSMKKVKDAEQVAPAPAAAGQGQQ